MHMNLWSHRFPSSLTLKPLIFQLIMNSMEVGSMGTPLLELTSTSLTGDANLKTVSYKGCGALCHLLRDVSLFYHRMILTWPRYSPMLKPEPYLRKFTKGNKIVLKMTAWNSIYRSFNDESFSADWAKLVFRHNFEKLRVFFILRNHLLKSLDLRFFNRNLMILGFLTHLPDTLFNARLVEIMRHLNRIILRIVMNGHGTSVQKIAIWSVVRLSLLRSWQKDLKSNGFTMIKIREWLYGKISLSISITWLCKSQRI